MVEYGLIGEKLGHSFSKEIHEAIADYKYDLIELDKEELKSFMANKDFRAVNVTIPYKKDVIPYLYQMSEAAKSIGAVNCIRNDGGKLIGHNTDFDGLFALIKKLDIDVKNKKVLILGTGGTSETAKAVCRHMEAAEIIKVSRTAGKDAVTYETAYRLHSDAEVIINTTPCGMYPKTEGVPIKLENFKKLGGVVDVIYNPLRTKLIQQAETMGIKAGGGLYMLVAQAVKACEFFLETELGDELDRVYKKILTDKTNIVLTGMPASGKSTIGKVLAKELGRPFFDTDLMIEAEEKMRIPEIFEKYGEAYFRDAESQIIKKVATENGAIIATGGGAILRNENIENLKFNGKIFFRDRNPELLKPTADRPKAFNKEEMMKRYKERYPIYSRTADCIVKNQNSIQAAAAKIMEEFQ